MHEILFLTSRKDATGRLWTIMVCLVLTTIFFDAYFAMPPRECLRVRMLAGYSTAFVSACFAGWVGYRCLFLIPVLHSLLAGTVGFVLICYVFPCNNGDPFDSLECVGFAIVAGAAGVMTIPFAAYIRYLKWDGRRHSHGHHRRDYAEHEAE